MSQRLQLSDDMIDHDSDRDTYRIDVGNEPDSVSMLVVSAVADLTDTDPLELPQLHTVVDPEALDTLFEPWSDDGPRSGGVVSFTYVDYEVSVHGDGVVEIRPTG